MAQYGMQPRGNRFSPGVQGPPRDSSMLAQVAERRLKDRAGNAPPVPQTAVAPVTRQTPTAAPPPPSVALPVAPTTPAADPRAQARQQAIQNIRGQQPSLPGMTQLPSAPGQQITPTGPDGGLSIKKAAIQQAAAQKAAAQEKAQEPGDLPPPSDPDFFGEAGTGLGESDEFGAEGQPYGTEKSQFEEENLAPGSEYEGQGDSEEAVAAEAVTDAETIETKKAKFIAENPLPEGWVYAFDENGEVIGSHPEGEEFGGEPGEEYKEHFGTEDEDEDNALMTQAEKELQSILSGEGEFGMTDEELANQEAIIQKAAQQAKADLSQQMSGRGLGMSGIAGAGFGNIDAQSIAAMQELKFKNAQLAIDEKLNTLNSISKLYGHLLTEEDRMKIAEMQFDLENQKLEDQREADAESNWWNDMADSLALGAGDFYSDSARQFAAKAKEMGLTPLEIQDAFYTEKQDDPTTDGIEYVVKPKKNSDLYQKVMGGESGEGGPPPWSEDEPWEKDYDDHPSWDEAIGLFAESYEGGFESPPPGWPWGLEDWSAMTDVERNAEWWEWVGKHPEKDPNALAFTV